MMSHHDMEEVTNVEHVPNGNVTHENISEELLALKEMMSAAPEMEIEISVLADSNHHHHGDDHGEVEIAVPNSQVEKDPDEVGTNGEIEVDVVADGSGGATPPSPPPSVEDDLDQGGTENHTAIAAPAPPTPKTSTLNALLDSVEFRRELQRLVAAEMENKPRPASAVQQLQALLASQTSQTSPTRGKSLSSPSSAANTLESGTQGHHQDQVFTFSSVAAPHTTTTASTPSTRGHGAIIAINDLRGEEAQTLSTEEKQLRCEVAALHRLVDMHGWTSGLYHHISAKLRSTKAILMSPMGVLYHEISASNLVKLSLADENVSIGGAGDSVTAASRVHQPNWMMHAAIHKARSDSLCIVHLHLPDVIAVSCMKCGLLPVSAEAEELLLPPSMSHPASSHTGAHPIPQGLVHYHAYMGTSIAPTSSSSSSRLLQDLGSDGQVLFLRNHGALVLAASVEEAWQRCRLVVAACEAQMKLVRLAGVDTAREAGSHFKGASPRSSPATAQLEFEAMMRLLDHAGYRTGYQYQRPQLVERMIDSFHEAVRDAVSGEDTTAQMLTTSPPSALMSSSAYEYDPQRSQINFNGIRQQVATNRQKATQRTQFLAQKQQSARSPLKALPNTILEEPEVKIEAKKSKQVSKAPPPPPTVTISPPPSAPATAPTQQQQQQHVTVQSAVRVPKNTHIEKSATFSAGAASKHGTADHHGKTGHSDLEVSDSEHHHKKGIKIAGIRIPSFSRKKK